APLLQKLASVRESLPEVPGRRGDNHLVRHIGGNVVSSPKFEAARVLKCFGRQHQLYSQPFAQPRRLNDRGGPKDVGLHALSMAGAVREVDAQLLQLLADGFGKS